MSPCRPPPPRVYSGAECVFLVFFSVKLVWSGNHGDSLVFADKKFLNQATYIEWSLRCDQGTWITPHYNIWCNVELSFLNNYLERKFL